MNFIRFFCSKSIESKSNEIVTGSVSGKNNAVSFRFVTDFVDLLEFLLLDTFP